MFHQFSPPFENAEYEQFSLVPWGVQFKQDVRLFCNRKNEYQGQKTNLQFKTTIAQYKAVQILGLGSAVISDNIQKIKNQMIYFKQVSESNLKKKRLKQHEGYRRNQLFLTTVSLNRMLKEFQLSVSTFLQRFETNIQNELTKVAAQTRFAPRAMLILDNKTKKWESKSGVLTLQHTTTRRGKDANFNITVDGYRLRPDDESGNRNLFIEEKVFQENDWNDIKYNYMHLYACTYGGKHQFLSFSPTANVDDPKSILVELLYIPLVVNWNDHNSENRNYELKDSTQIDATTLSTLLLFINTSPLIPHHHFWSELSYFKLTNYNECVHMASIIWNHFKPRSVPRKQSEYMKVCEGIGWI